MVVTRLDFTLTLRGLTECQHFHVKKPMIEPGLFPLWWDNQKLARSDFLVSRGLAET